MAAPKSSPPSPPKPPPAARPRRQHRRLTIRMSAEVRTARTVFTATTRDLSAGGAGIISDRGLTEGEEIALGLFLVVDDVEEQMPPLWVKGRVMWASGEQLNQHTAGVRFSGVTDEQKKWLGKVLSQLNDPGATPAPDRH
ncbi:MAG TPA: PilZ domain-containing protein [Polyangia bacterium]|jgi:c-di-GMP-binding flagellar brake protein YcgR|nr:PilZ domain-containing protein [Polyangia bacterium]